MFPETNIFDEICAKKQGIDRLVLEKVITLAVELAREGREGRKIGTLFTVYDSDTVLERSKCLILDPLFGHPDQVKRIDNPNMRETIKELAQLDGAFVVSDSGVVISACRYLNASATGIDLPLGLGSRHMAAASISRETRAIAVVVSESSVVRVFDDGKLVSEIIPELWVLSRYSLHLSWPYLERTTNHVTVVSKED
ncbi:MAG: DNA integrity scanning protein DisA nucleotide-binding domain protein [Deltaproteobacteria bacterium]|nr:DNA integrity scanning protein DisA nucleotide-binding domain protein [Deltaproteobacteria bacterium]MBW1951776.1 DNA integrity scanning protein DisA nucleotide-binding domain protein [Deltaproteobacteria bacterium]MBW1987807.1 DNA integrity scanning protein DisA nucleotide-binding domain protein [Deltaproteobacteria bacterium]MBW2134951.1 DNA integrity scanning protein DisA nucleotide-binding domain protein [Deltaproteobacteria bacterium]